MNGLTLLIAVVCVGIGYLLGWCDGLNADVEPDPPFYRDTYD